MRHTATHISISDSKLARMEAGQQCYAPVLMPVLCYHQVPHFALPPPSVTSVDDSSDCSRSLDELDDIASQLEYAITYEREWCEVEEKLFVRVFSMPLLSKCFVESEDGEYRNWGQNCDFDALFKIIGWKYKSVGVIRETTKNVTFLSPTGERKIMHIPHALRKIRAYPNYIGILITKENCVYHIQCDFFDNASKPHEDLEQYLTLSLLRAASRDGTHISFW